MKMVENQRQKMWNSAIKRNEKTRENQRENALRANSIDVYYRWLARVLSLVVAFYRFALSLVFMRFHHCFSSVFIAGLCIFPSILFGWSLCSNRIFLPCMFIRFYRRSLVRVIRFQFFSRAILNWGPCWSLSICFQHFYHWFSWSTVDQ